LEVTAPYQQNATGSMAYPAPGTLNRLMFKTPLIWWRMGLGRILGGSMLVLTTWGRKSHKSRHTMLSYTLVKGCVYVQAGWGSNCDWYQNLLHDPHVTVQAWSMRVTGMKGEMVMPAIARRVTEEGEFRQVSHRLFETGGDSHFKPWLSSLGIAYDHEDLVAKRERVHQVALDPQPADLRGTSLDPAFPLPMQADLKWLWGVMAVALVIGWLAFQYSTKHNSYKR
jgi:deazaflavin-dependent oxidoreductase (nitroreductase family)